MPISPQALAQFLAQTAVLRGCPPEVLSKLAPHVDQQSFAPGKNMIAPGAPVATLNFLYAGRASLQIADAGSGTRVTLEDVLPGDTFGEVGFLLGGASPMFVVAEDEATGLFIQKAHFDKIAQVLPEVVHALAKRVAARFVKVSVLGGKRAQARPEPPPPVAEGAAAPAAPGSLPKGVIPFVEVAQYPVSSKALELMPTRVMLEHRLLPLDVRGKTLVVGMVSPHSMAAREELRRVLHNVDPEIVAISADDYGQTLVRLKLDVRDRAPQAVAVSRALRPQYQAEIKKEAEKQIHVVGDEVVNLIDRIFVEALDRGVSDIHIEPEATNVRVRYRVQGMLQDRKEIIPASFAAPIVARIKVLAELDITERRLPQDGRIVAQVGPREINFRISTLASARGEKVVVRILDPGDVMRPLEHIFLDPRGLELVQRAIASTHGAIVVGGATGSGKSSTLYSLLNQRRITRPDNNIVTVEDPIEFLISGLSQSPVNLKAGLEYPTIVRAVLRQDPDVLMIGELREPQTAAIMVEAALTGHLVLTTIHGGGVPQVLQRFLQFGFDMMRIGQAVNVIVVQRLARRLCGSCVREDEVAPQLVAALIARKLLMKGGGTRLPRTAGCDACNMSGYRGRVPIVEILALDEEVRLGLVSGVAVPDVLAKAAERGQFLSFGHCAKLLMARKALTAADALSATD